MVDIFYIGAYWRNRNEDLSIVVDKTVLFLQELSSLDEQFVNWYEQGYNKKEASKKVTIEKDIVERLYKRGIKKNDLDSEGHSKIGYSIGLWTGQEEEYSSSLSINAGHASKFFSNACVITVPIAEEPKERLLKLDKQKAIINLLIKIWKPDTVVLNSNELKNKTGLVNKVGWITYLKNLKGYSQKSSKVIHEKLDNGDLFFLKLDDDRSYNYDLIQELLFLKEAV